MQFLGVLQLVETNQFKPNDFKNPQVHIYS